MAWNFNRAYTSIARVNFDASFWKVLYYRVRFFSKYLFIFITLCRSVLLSPFQQADNLPTFFSLHEATPNHSGEAIYEQVQTDVDYESNYILKLDCIPNTKLEDGKCSGSQVRLHFD